MNQNILCFVSYIMKQKTLHIFVSTLWNGDTKRELNNKCSGFYLHKKKVFFIYNVKCFTICNTYLAGIWPLVLGPQFFWQCWDAFCKNDVFIVQCSGQPLRIFSNIVRRHTVYSKKYCDKYRSFHILQYFNILIFYCGPCYSS